MAQLFMMDLELGKAKEVFPQGTKIRAIAFGCPPVFKARGGFNLNNIIMISNHNDCITGASLKCLDDIFLKAKAIQKLNLQRRTLIKMAFNKNSSSFEERDIVTDNIEEKENGEVVHRSIFSKARASVTKYGSKLVEGISEDMWDQVIINTNQNHMNQISL